MLEGHWTVRFLEPDDPEFDLNGGVLIIESSRILGGDSGYSYGGNIATPENGRWPVTITATRYDNKITSVFGDHDTLVFEGNFTRGGISSTGFPILKAELYAQIEGKPLLSAELVKIAELP